jgi:predicted RNase H-like HicB family nuclease
MPVLTAYGLAGEPEGRRSHRKKLLETKRTRKRRRKPMPADIKYEIILYWSKEDQAFIAEVPELPGCAADGSTYQEAVTNAERVIREWIATAQELGRPIPSPRGRLMYA